MASRGELVLVLLPCEVPGGKCIGDLFQARHKNMKNLQIDQEIWPKCVMWLQSLLTVMFGKAWPFQKLSILRDQQMGQYSVPGRLLEDCFVAQRAICSNLNPLHYRPGIHIWNYCFRSLPAVDFLEPQKHRGKKRLVAVKLGYPIPSNGA